MPSIDKRAFLVGAGALAASSALAQTPSAATRVVLQTALGAITLELAAAAPVTATNFLRYVDAKFYDGSYQDWLARKLPVTAGSTP